MKFNGAILINKPKGLSSYDVVDQIKKAINDKAEKIGHTGTLDPQVDGLLVVVLGSATKLIQRLQNHRKTYRGQITLGFSTDTQDLEGKIVESKPVEDNVNNASIDEALRSLTGKLIQTPPMYSAVKVNGKKLYEYARAGETVDIPSREVTVYNFERTSDLKINTEKQTASFSFEAEVSSGTYIRTLAYDLGVKLDTPTTMTELTRMSADGFELEDAHYLSEAIEMAQVGTLNKIILPVNKLIDEVKVYKLSTNEWQKVKNGNPVTITTNHNELAMSYDNVIKAIYYVDGTQFVAKTMLLDNDN